MDTTHYLGFDNNLMQIQCMTIKEPAFSTTLSDFRKEWFREKLHFEPFYRFSYNKDSEMLHFDKIGSMESYQNIPVQEKKKVFIATIENKLEVPIETEGLWSIYQDDLKEGDIRCLPKILFQKISWFRDVMGGM